MKKLNGAIFTIVSLLTFVLRHHANAGDFGPDGLALESLSPTSDGLPAVETSLTWFWWSMVCSMLAIGVWSALGRQSNASKRRQQYFLPLPIVAIGDHALHASARVVAHLREIHGRTLVFLSARPFQKGDTVSVDLASIYSSSDTPRSVELRVLKTQSERGCSEYRVKATLVRDPERSFEDMRQALLDALSAKPIGAAK